MAPTRNLEISRAGQSRTEPSARARLLTDIRPRPALEGARVLPQAFVDTHVHFLDQTVPGLNYDWLARDAVHPTIGDIDGLKVQRYGPREFEAESRFQNVTKAIHVQASFEPGDPVAETRWVQDLANATGVPHGIIGLCDLGASDAAAKIDEHLASPNLRGFRDTSSAHRFDDPVWRAGYARLGSHDLVLCHHVGVEHADRAARLAHDFPAMTFCLDHAAMPLARDEDFFRVWVDAIRTIAEQPNTVCKISGFGQVDHRWTVESLRPWVLGCIEAFGTNRCFFGSNWPVDRLSGSYPDLVGAYREIVSGFSPDEQVALLSRNAERTFRI
jgi:predicted TIM-barrel fold metal-dependent hydrolase